MHAYRGREERPSDASGAAADAFKQMAIQGQTVLVASGDCGGSPSSASGDCRPGSGVSFPANLQHVTAVGGTTPTLYIGGRWAAEAAWPSSGGGVSKHILQPSWQSGTPGLPSRQRRVVPDLALAADADVWPHEIWTPSANFTTTGGTAAAAAVWAGYALLLNQCRRARKLPQLGPLAPHVYNGMARAPAAWQSALHDVAAGSNGAFTAGAGFDAITGWGSMHGARMLNLLCPSWDPVRVLPAAGGV